MTRYIMRQLRFLCDHPDIFCEAIEYWDFKPEREKEAIRRILKPIHLNKLLVDPKLIRGAIFEGEGTALSFKTKDDPHEYIVFGIICGENCVHVGLAQRKLASDMPN